VATVAPGAAETVEPAELIGVVTTRRSEIVPVPFAGKILKVEVKPNMRIRKGDLIAKLDDRDLRDQIQRTKSDENQGRAAAGADGTMAAVAQAEATRLYRAYKAGAVSKAMYEAKLGEARSSGSRSGVGGAQAAGARANRETLERQLAQASILAPFDGIAMNIKAREGAVAQKDEAIVRLYDPSDLTFKFSVPKQWRKDVAVGTRVELKIEGVERSIWATVERIADEEAPLNMAVAEADIDDSKLAPDEVRIASVGRVYLADNKVAARKAVR
jgi:multidrug efflux pump subunit AcrA (membrane-fusion protein)